MEKPQKLALDSDFKETLSISDKQMIEIARQGLLKFGKLSVPYLMRKLKLSPSKAKQIMEEAMRAT